MYIGRKFADCYGWLKRVINEYLFNYDTFSEVHKYIQKGLINGAADSALVLFTVDDYFNEVIKKLPRNVALTLSILWMTGCITLNIANLASDDLEKLANGDLKVFFASCKICIRPLLSFLNGFNLVGVPVFLFVEVLNLNELFSDEGYITFQSIVMGVSALLGLYDAQKTLREELQNLLKVKNLHNSSSSRVLSEINNEIENSKCGTVCKLTIEVPRLVLLNYLDWTALGFYLSFIRKLFNSKLPFEPGSKTTTPFLLFTAALIPKVSHKITTLLVEKYKEDAKTNVTTQKNLCWKKCVLAASKFFNVSYDILSRLGANTVIFLVIKHTLEVINDTSYDYTRAAQISELFTMCAVALSMYHEAIDSGRRNIKGYKDDLDQMLGKSALSDEMTNKQTFLRINAV